MGTNRLKFIGLGFVLSLVILTIAADVPLKFLQIYGTGGIVVSSNALTGVVTVDGSGISSPTGGVSAAVATNIAIGNAIAIQSGKGNNNILTNPTISGVLTGAQANLTGNANIGGTLISTGAITALSTITGNGLGVTNLGNANNTAFQPADSSLSNLVTTATALTNLPYTIGANDTNYAKGTTNGLAALSYAIGANGTNYSQSVTGGLAALSYTVGANDTNFASAVTNSSGTIVSGNLNNSGTVTGSVVKATGLKPVSATASRIATIAADNTITNGPNGTGMLTNDGTGVFGWMSIPASAGGTNAIIQTNGVNVGSAGTINFVSGQNSSPTGAIASGVANIGITVTTTTSTNLAMISVGHIEAGDANFSNSVSVSTLNINTLTVTNPIALVSTNGTNFGTFKSGHFQGTNITAVGTVSVSGSANVSKLTATNFTLGDWVFVTNADRSLSISNTDSGITMMQLNGEGSPSVTNTYPFYQLSTMNVGSDVTNQGNVGIAGTLTGHAASFSAVNTSGIGTNATQISTTTDTTGTHTNALTQTPTLALVGPGSTISLKPATVNNVAFTNFIGLTNMVSSTVITCDASICKEWSVTNKIPPATVSVVFTNTVPGQDYSGQLIGTNTSQTVTFIPQITATAGGTNMIFVHDAYGTALATSYSITLTNGNLVEWSSKFRTLNGTNIHLLVTHQGSF